MHKYERNDFYISVTYKKCLKAQKQNVIIKKKKYFLKDGMPE